MNTMHFFQKLVHFLNLPKRVEETSPLLPQDSCAPVYISKFICLYIQEQKYKNMYKNILVKKTVYSSAILIKGFKDHAFWLHFFFSVFGFVFI